MPLLSAVAALIAWGGALTACGGAGTLRVASYPVLAAGAATERPLLAPPSPPRCALEPPQAALACYAPVVLQERAAGAAGRLDVPEALDPDGSGALADDADSAMAAPARRSSAGARVPYYASASADGSHLYLFYGLYYPADWSGPPSAPRIDHGSDFEGALVVVSRVSRSVEAAVTQAHRLFYLWLPQWPERTPGSLTTSASAVSGALPITSDGRPVLFAESGGHGLYAFARGAWRPRGGTRYPEGPAATPPERLLALDPGSSPEEPRRSVPPGSARSIGVEIRSLAELLRFTTAPAGDFRDLGRGARPPWLWSDRRGGRAGNRGAIVKDPATLLEALRVGHRP